MSPTRILIFGCGYTGKRVALRLLADGHHVVATARDAASITHCSSQALSGDLTNAETLEPLARLVTPDTLVLYSLPSIGDTDLTPRAVPYFAQARRVIYLSTTGVYGRQHDVDAATLPAPQTPREWLRVQAEETLRAAFPNTLILRPAAIYGPHRGIHSALRAGVYRLAENGGNFVSRIHVDDLAEHCIAGLLSDLTGAFPVADEEPCTSAEIAAYCAHLLNIPLPPAVAAPQLSETRRADRRVDGSSVRCALNVTLRYPNYRVGIPACIAAEASPPADATARAL